VNTTDVVTFYDNFLEHLKQDHYRDNQRLSRVKVKLGSIVKSGMTVLDLGCGTGLTSKFMATLGARVTAVDISPKLIEFAKENSAHKNIEYVNADITELNLDRKFDGITLVDVFEHVHPDKDRNTGALHGIMKLIDVINRHATDKAWVFINIPDSRYQEVAHQLIPNRLQIIDKGYEITTLLNWFGAIQFEPVEIDIYGIDVLYQYNSILFKRKSEIESTHCEFMKG